ncbi:MAG: lipopolysaccharide transport periplasmic protein LptA [Paracoccaceae bacterium]
MQFMRFLLAGLLAATPLLADAAGTSIAFGGLKTDPKAPVQVQADQLAVNQANGSAVFTGNVVITQGEMKLQAAVVNVEYATDTKKIKTLHASGGVTVAAGTDAAKSDEADYKPDTGDLVMTGNVLLTQGPAAISGQKLVLSLKTGTGTMEGRVTTTFLPGGK